MAVLATSLSLPGVRANSTEDWAKCLSIEKIPPSERISGCTAALASRSDSWAYSRAYYLRGQAHFDEQNFEAAVADVSQFLHSYPNNVQGLQVRAAAYFRQRNFDPAIADYTRVIEIEPKGSFAYIYRGDAYRAKGELDHGIADYSKAIEINPTFAFAYFGRAMIHWQRGSLSQSLADFDEAGRLNPKSAYAALWRDIIARRSDQPSRLADVATHLDMTKWPAPIVNLFLGTLTSQQVLDAADDSNPEKKRSKVCEANFYVAELALQRGARDDARRSLELAAADCPKPFVEGWAAAIELKTLRASP
ncbi:tetratricopeptide repeat protein [Bradyrhizobium viridifuturi]|uniref:tetratricopeptide repeat protein n=1 Tax=Bradyrhizobium viridifuturi TaxID=1654716 RepID=UPI00067ECB07|nr:tetratricopeptide repeat protein [Bradyrhizobium viridifuturi]